MPLVFLDGKLLDLPPRFSPGPLPPEAVAILNEINHNRIVAKLTYELQRGLLAPADAQTRADELAKAGFALSAEPPLDRRLRALARQLATETIQAKLAALGHALPKNLDPHIDALLAASPHLWAEAHRRLEAQLRAAHETLAALDAA